MNRSDVETIPLASLRFGYDEIGCIRRLAGLRGSLFLRRFEPVAQRIQAHLNKIKVESEADHCEFLRIVLSLMQLEVRGIYETRGPILVTRIGPIRTIEDGNHRCLALYLLGQKSVRAQIEPKTPTSLLQDCTGFLTAWLFLTPRRIVLPRQNDTECSCSGFPKTSRNKCICLGSATCSP